jgi:hypothetical protein
MSRMSAPSDSLIASAFALADSHGVELLAALAEFDVWRGDLSVMRGDDPPSAKPSPASSGVSESSVPRLEEAVAIARAIDRLDPKCRTVLAAFYGTHGRKTGPAASEVNQCRQRLVEKYESLAAATGIDDAITDWLVERNHAAAGHGGGR